MLERHRAAEVGIWTRLNSVLEIAFCPWLLYWYDVRFSTCRAIPFISFPALELFELIHFPHTFPVSPPFGPLSSLKRLAVRSSCSSPLRLFSLSLSSAPKTASLPPSRLPTPNHIFLLHLFLYILTFHRQALLLE